MKKLLTIFAFALMAITANAQSCPDENHPHVIDLGLTSGTKWACCNVGAEKPEDYGGYYAWGETEEKTTYNWDSYKYWSDTNGDGLHDTEEFTYLGSNIAGTQYDVAHVKLGGSWVMPSKEQAEELLNNCSYTWTTKNDISGGLFTGPSGGTIFLPAAGIRISDDLYNNNSYGIYWLSKPWPYMSAMGHVWLPGIAYVFGFDSSYPEGGSFNFCMGITIRPVINATTNINLPESSSDTSDQPIYNLYGIKVADNATDLNTLPPGIYIVNGKKMVIR